MTDDASPSPITSEVSGAATPRDTLLSVRGLSKRFRETEVLRDVSFDLRAGETLAVLGDSGCGKTTLLRIIAGLLEESTGDVILGGRPLAGVSPRDRGVVYLDQEPLLFEHLTVRENVAFALRLRGRPPREVDESADALLAAIGLAAHAGKRDGQLSGGQKQRVAFARAVLAAPRVLLLDEPFSSLDGTTRSAMRELFASLRERFALTSLFVTHDVKEALVVGNRFALMAEGRLRIFRDRAAFLADEATGIPREIRFWRDAANTTIPDVDRDGPPGARP